MNELWTSDAPAFSGKYVSFEDVSFFPRPVQQPHIPLFIGGTGPRPFQRVGPKSVSRRYWPQSFGAQTNLCLRKGRLLRT